ncbi:4-oxalomesaconate tautomerase [Achromobacter sp. DH1f]|uniref:4-oxalomesaconate tautomerase n=1 Tax=Achromobacter sp. DH1f TaxID=1397275 RepID=UPI0004A7BF01|nr:4-oxalomesaconate tautomerase [Achromobacter sp. DH1f]
MSDLYSIPATLFRGGTSKGPLFLAQDLPADKQTLDAVLLSAMGSPHKRQVDGVGGAESLTSKVVIVSGSSREDADIDYLFAQVNPDSPIVDYSSNCGNMLSAIGPFAIESGLVKAAGNETRIRIYNANTDSVIVATIQTPDGSITYEGNAAIDGVPGTSAPVIENFAGTVGSKTKKMLPTGKVTERIEGIEVTCIDVAVPAVLIAAQALGLRGDESKAELDAMPDLIKRLDDLRVEAGQRMGLGDCRKLVIPKPLVVSAARHGGAITSRDFVPYNCHATHSVTGATALAAASILPGSVAQQITGLSTGERHTVGIEHPAGTMAMDVRGETGAGGHLELVEANLLRTARRLFSGGLAIPSRIWNGDGKAANVADIARHIDF